MRKHQIIMIFCMATALSSYMHATTWNYDFGTATGSYSTAGQSTTFLPAAPSGTSRIRVGTAGGSINMDNPGLSAIGSGTELRIVAPTSAQYNKFAIYDYTASQVFQIRFTMLLGSSIGGNVNSGTFYFINGDGDRFSGNSGFSDDQSFAAFQMIFGAGGTITLRYRNTGAWTTINSTPVAQSTALELVILGNNSSAPVNYAYTGNSNSLGVNKIDLWINGTLYGNDLQKDRLADSANIDSFMFYGDSSTGNVANLFLDDITYQNSISSDITLPVELSSFTAIATANNFVELTWVTQSETGASGYYVYRNASNSLPDAQIVSPCILATNTSMEQTYSYVDDEIQSGTWYYWLQHLDLDGQSALHGPISIILNDNIDIEPPVIPQSSGLQSIYPNPFNFSTTIAFGIAKSEQVRIEIFNSKGQIVRDIEDTNLNIGNYRRNWNGSDNYGSGLPSGIYTIRMTAGKYCYTKKAVLVK